MNYSGYQNALIFMLYKVAETAGLKFSVFSPTVQKLLYLDLLKLVIKKAYNCPKLPDLQFAHFLGNED